ncbi:MAG: DEAD/DEAH box helicase [Eubacteriales bacterium]
MFDPIDGSQALKEIFINYITTRFSMENQEYRKMFRAELSKENMIAKGPYLDIGGAFETGQTLEQLANAGTISPLFQSLEPVHEEERELNLQRPLYFHQEQAMRKASQGKNLVVTTGTGSGKTECFLLPILQSILAEKEAGTLDAGVRAIVIYPMNALASDQMKRMRKLLKNSDITFGLYNGNTKHTERDALQNYKNTHKNEDGRSNKPLKNELISREVMQETPPNILITNYSMLEYMLLRPKDDGVFSGAKLKFIILDEAHIYKGATGMETSLLMRRVRARISNDSAVQYILTSATLGGKDADEEIVAFATRLCGANFLKEDIIRSVEKKEEMKASLDFSSGIFTNLLENLGKTSKILAENQADFSPSGNQDEKLFEFFLHSRLFEDFRKFVKTPLTLQELQEKLSRNHNISLKELIALISVCAMAEKNGANLIKPRYHFFVRALEGLFIGIGETKELFLQQKNTVMVGETEKEIFEAAVCGDCGRLALVGRLEGGYLRQVNRFDEGIEFYLLKEATDGEYIEEEGSTGEEDEIACQDYVVCSLCGAMDTELGAKISNLCEHEKKHYVALKKANTRGDGRIKARCPACEFGDLMQMYLGSEAATAVLGTGLFELLPKEEVLDSSWTEMEEILESENDPFTMVSEPVIPKRAIMPQFLCFSDSRSEAAFFASYMERSYQEFLRRRGIWHVAESLRDEGKTIVDMEFFVTKLEKYFVNHKTFLEWTPSGSGNADVLKAKSREQAWAGILNEMYNARRSTSLVSLGLLSFEYEKNESQVAGFQKMYSLEKKEARALLELLVQDIVYAGAIHPMGKEMLSESEHEYIFFTKRPKKVVLLKEGETHSKNYISGWLARKRTNGNFFTNSRLSRLVRDLGLTEEAADQLMRGYWFKVLQPTEEEFSLPANEFQIRLGGTQESQFYRCQKCGRLTPYSVKSHCSSIKCTGTLVPCNPLEENVNNHYVNLYRSETMTPLYIKEHTAQLSKNQQTAYQEAFQHKQIHALSCSTTFEMGVDLGSLETVYLRDVPPSPANYVQRAGRAGRGRKSAAFVLTYAKLSSHDFNYYQDPTGMISGKIKVPIFNVENEKILKRHIFAVALSKFFSDHEEVYNNNNQTVLLNEGGYELLKDYLSPVPVELTEILKKSIPKVSHKTMGILDGSWTKLLLSDEQGDEGVLELAVQDFRATIETIEKELKKARRNKDDTTAAYWSKTLAGFRGAKEDNDGKNKKRVIDFLVRSNVLPKYGFPVDTVELATPFGMDAKYKDVQLQRDLQMAIADYAPGAQVVADGKMYTSRYLRKIPGKSKESIWEQGHYCPKCPHCKQPNFTKEPMTTEGKLCISCQQPIGRRMWKKTIEPRMGFFAEQHTKDVPMRRPERDYKTDDYYIGDSSRMVIDVLGFSVNDKELYLESTTNDSLVVIGQTEYHVCALCGYTSETPIAEHRNAQNYPCANKEGNPQRYQLSHDFKTDVVKLTFKVEESSNHSLMLSVLFAILEGLSQELGIERTDLKGCLFWTQQNGMNGYSLVLYDAVAGGAGHVRRMATSDGVILKKVLKRAYHILERCACDTSCYQCLRNYYNQKIHDELSRKEAMIFLEKWLGEYEVLEIEKPERVFATVSEEIDSEDEFSISEDTLYGNEEENWATLHEIYFENSDELLSWDDANISMDCLICPKLHLRDGEVVPWFFWKEEKVLVFQNKEAYEGHDFISLDLTCYDMSVPVEELAKKLRGE